MMNLNICNDTLDDEFIMLNLEDFEEDDLSLLVKILSKGIMSDNVEAIEKVKEWAENCGFKIKEKGKKL